MESPLFNWLDQRGVGLLLHPTSLPGREGIGTFGADLKRLIAFMKQAGFTYWQTLPFGPTGYGDCPYSSFSAMAGNPYLIDLTALVDAGLLPAADLAEISRLPDDHVEFDMIFRLKWPLLKLAYRRFVESGADEVSGYGSFKAFKAEKAAWLDSYALFMALKADNGGRPWYEWSDAVKFRKNVREGALSRAVREDAEAQRFYQYLFFGQWNLVRQWTAEAGISIIGDIPFYVSRDSADVWAHPEVFELDADLNCKSVAGVPPDYFSKDGQLWGNPLYNWTHLKKSGYKWWMERLEASFALFDVVRLDHFRAFHNYWCVPAGAKTACTGKWLYGPDMDFFRAVKAKFENPRLIAEDLGFIDDGVRLLLKNSGLPGMGVLHFGFDCETENLNLPHNIVPNEVLYAGTHDNNTSRGWYESLPPSAQDQLRRYLRINGNDVAWDLVRECYHSASRLAIVTAQDLLSLGSGARMNVPGMALGNWKWRMTAHQFDELLGHAGYLDEIAWLYGRRHKEKKTGAKKSSTGA
jgi:4-alpha-glucanotransferase